MEITKSRHLWIGLGIGVFVGALIGFFSNKHIIQSEIYSVQILSQTTAIKINKRTGETWRFYRGESDKGWQPIVEAKPTKPEARSREAFPWDDFKSGKK